jgi:uncharacterized protein
MTPQEKDLIQTVFDRLARAGGGAKDAEAESFIQEQVRRQPDAAYGLTQAVIVLEAGLKQAEQKIAELQRQLDDGRAGAGSSGGSFLGGSPWGGSSVPRSGPATQPQPAYSPQPTYYQPQPQPQQPWPGAAPQGGPWTPQPSGGGSFLRNAATMAAGVAGGTLIAEGLSSMFGHHYGGYGGFGGGFGGGPEIIEERPEIIEERTTINNNYFDDRDRGGRDSGVQDASYQDDSSYDDGGSFGDGGFDDGGTDV